MPARLYDIALFDLDGTIADTLPLIYEAFNAAIVPALGREFSPAEIRAMFGPPDTQIIRSRVNAREAEGAIARYVRHYIDFHDDLVSTFPGIDTLIRTCAATALRIAVITGKSRRTALITLEKLDLRSLFDVVYAGDDVERQKPAPDALLLALRDLDMSRSDRAVMIGDSAADVFAGKAAGIATIGVTWGSPELYELEAAAPDFIVSSAVELEALLLPR